MEVEVFKNILKLISEEGLSLRKALKKVHVGSETFYKFIDSDLEYQKQYARACEDRAEFIFDEIFDIADDNTMDVKIIDTKLGEVEITDNDVIQRAKLKVDARKWALSKMNPKKYGDKIEVDQNNSGEITVNINNNIV